MLFTPCYWQHPKHLLWSVLNLHMHKIFGTFGLAIHFNVRQLWMPLHACHFHLLCNWHEQSVHGCKRIHGVGAGDLYLAAMDAIYAVNPNVLFFIEGTGQSGLADNWGDGLCTDASTISSYGISDPNPFFTTLMGKQYLDQVCICLLLMYC